MASVRPPNILLIHSDQHRSDCLGGTGHPVLRTPNLDRLAAEGVSFSHAFTPSPICTPERASLLTGLWPTQHRSINITGTESYRPARADAPTWPARLRDAGYWLGYVGKFHQELPVEPDGFGFHEFVPLRDYASWREAQGLEPPPRTNGWFGEIDHEATPEQTQVGWGASHTLRMLRRAAGGDRPWLIRWDPSEPHLPCTPPGMLAAAYPPASAPPWPSFGDPLENKPYAQRNQLRRWGVEGWTWDDWAPVAARYLAVIANLDRQVGRLLDELEALGLADDTLVVYTTDHGDLCGGHGMMDKHYIMYEDVVRVPLILRHPAALPAGRTCDAFVSHAIDLASTVCRAAGVAPPAGAEGVDLLPLARGQADGPRDDIFSQWLGGQMGLYSQRMVRDRRWKYVYNATAHDELYDLAADPAEHANRIDDPAAAADLARLRGRLIAWMESIADPLLNPWTRADLAP